MDLGLVLAQEDAVPGRPLHQPVPSDESQLLKVIFAAQDGLGRPKVLHDVPDVRILKARKTQLKKAKVRRDMNSTCN